MRTPKITAKRVLGLTLAGALAIAGTVAVAQSSQAAVQALKLSKVSGGPLAGTVITVTGKAFQNAAGADKVGKLYFTTTACVADASPATGNVPSVTNIVSATKLTLTTKALAATNGMKGTLYNLCVQDTAGTEVIGTAKYMVYPGAYINAANFLTSTSGPTSGGTSVTISGENFSSKSTASIGGKALTNVKVVVGTDDDATASNGDDTLTGTVPAGTAGTADVVVDGVGGKATAAAAFTYVASAGVVPSSGKGTANTVITVTGTGFEGKTFADAALAATVSSEVVLSPASGIVTTTLPGSPVYCTGIQVVSDTELNCKLPALTSAQGAYTVQVVDTTTATAVTTATGVSVGSTYTVAPF